VNKEIRFVNTSKEWIICFENKIPAWCYYNDNPNNKDNVKLFNWYALNYIVENKDRYKNLIDEIKLKKPKYSGIRYIDGNFYGLGLLSTYWLFEEKKQNMSFCIFKTIDNSHYKDGWNFKGCGFSLPFEV